jgi:hypothetical protein
MNFHRHARLGARILVLAAAAGSTVACATVVRGTNQDFVVESTPPGARVVTSNGFECDATPCTFRMPRRPGFDVTVSLEGYATRTLTVDSAISGGGGGAMAGNLLLGGVVGAGVDVASGAMNDLKPNPLHVILLTPAEQARADREAAAAAAAAPADD